MRTTLVLVSFLPFLFYATKDALFHFQGRRVSLVEHLLHLAIGVALAIVVINAVLQNTGVMLAGLVFFAVAGGLDEYVWHRGIPEVESDLHAKEHLALLLFVVVTLVVNWLDTRQWQLPTDWRSAVSSNRSLNDAWSSDRVSLAAAGPIRFRGENNSPPWWRTIAVPVLLLPYAYFGLRDNLQHLQSRRVSWTERILHAAIVVALCTVVPQAIFGRREIMLVGLVLFLVARVADEWIFHRRLPAHEVELHAHTHFAFLVFLISLACLDHFAYERLA